jgi:hypothetical protein
MIRFQVADSTIQINKIPFQIFETGFYFICMSRPEIAIHKKYPYGKP